MNTSRYISISGSGIRKIIMRPNWLDDSGNVVSDSVLLEQGIYPVQDSKPLYDAFRQRIERRPLAEWRINIDHVAVTYNVIDKTLEEVRQEKQQAITAAYNQELGAILKDYPEAETKTWDKQEQEARAWAADNTASTPLLTEIANARGMTLADLVPRVIAKADAWVQLSGAATGKRQMLMSSIAEATTIEEVEAIQW